MKSFLGIGYGSWGSIAVNVACFCINYASYNFIQPNIAPAMGMGFHVGLIFMCVMTDRLFLAPIRKEIDELEFWATFSQPLPPGRNQKLKVCR